MNGTISTLKDEIKKNELGKKRDKFKFIISILSSNLLVASLFLMNSPTPCELRGEPLPKSAQKTLHLGHQMLTLPLKLYLSDERLENIEVPIALISEEGKVVIKKAFLHEKIKPGGPEELAQFKIEIADHEILKIQQKNGQAMIAVPYVSEKMSQPFIARSKYEVLF